MLRPLARSEFLALCRVSQRNSTHVGEKQVGWRCKLHKNHNLRAQPVGRSEFGCAREVRQWRSCVVLRAWLHDVSICNASFSLKLTHELGWKWKILEIHLAIRLCHHQDCKTLEHLPVARFPTQEQPLNGLRVIHQGRSSFHDAKKLGVGVECYDTIHVIVVGYHENFDVEVEINYSGNILSL